MADDDGYVLIPCICCGLPAVIFLIHNFGFELFYGGPNIFGLILVLGVGLIFTLLGVKLLS